MTENEIGSIVINAAFEVHKKLGPGLLESTYEACLAYEIMQRGLFTETQVGLPVIYKDINLHFGYRIDIRVEEKVLIEIKVVEAFHDVHLAQMLTYMKLSGAKLGYLINFNVAKLKTGIKRLVLGYL